jgi:hypothetical protein
VDPVPDPLLLSKSGSAGNRTEISGSVSRNSDNQTTEVMMLRKFTTMKVSINVPSMEPIL